MIYALVLLLCVTPWVTSAGALALGLFFSLGLSKELPRPFVKLGKGLLQTSIVALGFSLDPQAVWRAGISGVGLTAATLGLTFLAGALVAKALGLRGALPKLIAVGTGICGGSAIAAVAPVLGAERDEMTISLSCVFLLNAVALLVFPPLGHQLGLSPLEFGTFAAIAIHDTSSVVGAATRFGFQSLPTAVTIKLTRALWILPLVVAVAWWEKRRSAGKASVPWFIPLFLAAVSLRALYPQFVSFYATCGVLGKYGLNGAIFLASAQTSRAALRRVGARPFLFALLLWAWVILLAWLFVAAG